MSHALHWGLAGLGVKEPDELTRRGRHTCLGQDRTTSGGPSPTGMSLLLCCC